MLNNMVASFTASNQIGEAMKKGNLKKKKGSVIKKTDKKEVDQKLNTGQDEVDSV